MWEKSRDLTLVKVMTRILIRRGAIFQSVMGQDGECVAGANAAADVAAELDEIVRGFGWS